MQVLSKDPRSSLRPRSDTLSSWSPMSLRESSESEPSRLYAGPLMNPMLRIHHPKNHKVSGPQTQRHQAHRQPKWVHLVPRSPIASRHSPGTRMARPQQSHLATINNKISTQKANEKLKETRILKKISINRGRNYNIQAIRLRSLKHSRRIDAPQQLRSSDPSRNLEAPRAFS